MHHTHTHARTRAHTQQPIDNSATASGQNSAQATGYKVQRVDPSSGGAIWSDGEIRMGFVYNLKGSTRGSFRVSEKHTQFSSAVTNNQTLLNGKMYELSRPGVNSEREKRVYEVISLWGDSSTPSSSPSSSCPPLPPRYTVQKDGKRYNTYFSTERKNLFIKVNDKSLFLQSSLTTLSLEVGSSYTFGSETQINSGSFKVMEISKPKLQGNEPLPPWVWTPPAERDSKSESRKRKRQNYD